jgi:2-methylisocitrate lyase-like PEP mutase family enzyme
MPKTNPADALRNALNGPDIVMAPGAPDSITARLIEQAGFPAVYMTGFGATASRLGTPDLGLLTQTEMTTHARDMVRAVTIPVVADADTGYGGPSNIQRTVVEFLQARVAAIHLEDQQSPKRCGQMAGVRLLDAAENADRIRCAVDARSDEPLLIIARTDALPGAGAQEAADRAHRYHDAGADLVFVDGIKTIEEVEQIARLVTAPKVVSIVDGNETTALDAKALHDMGFDMVLYAVTALFSALHAVRDALAVLHRDGTPAAASDRMLSYQEFCELANLAHHQTLDDRFGR